MRGRIPHLRTTPLTAVRAATPPGPVEAQSEARIALLAAISLCRINSRVYDVNSTFTEAKSRA